MKVLAIETSCDDTSLAIVSYRQQGIYCEAMYSNHQTALHDSYGGVVPELASREHLYQLIPVLTHLTNSVTGTNDTDILMHDIDAIAVTSAPGLPGSLIMGRTAALVLAKWYQKPYHYVNHLHGHIVSWLVDTIIHNFSNFLVVSLSGGHSDLSILSQDILSEQEFSTPRSGRSFFVEKIASTRDDALGEVFDKISRLLGGPYPGGARLSQQALQYDQDEKEKQYPFAHEKFKRILLSDTLDFSFSGLKSQAGSFITRYRKCLQLDESDLLPQLLINYLAHEFQEAVGDIMSARILQVVKSKKIDGVALVGGVAANFQLRAHLEYTVKNFINDTGSSLDFLVPQKIGYCMDNAAMIGAAALLSLEYKKSS